MAQKYHVFHEPWAINMTMLTRIIDPITKKTELKLRKIMWWLFCVNLSEIQIHTNVKNMSCHLKLQTEDNSYRIFFSFLDV